LVQHERTIPLWEVAHPPAWGALTSDHHSLRDRLWSLWKPMTGQLRILIGSHYSRRPKRFTWR